MTYWKFLRAGAVSPFAAHVWESGRWEAAAQAQAQAQPQACLSGFHACRAQDLPYWLNDELWLVDLAPPVNAARHKVVATRSRLVARVAEWGPGAARELALACVLRTTKHAADELRGRGLDEEAGWLSSESQKHAEAMLAVTGPAQAGDPAVERARTAWADLAQECADKADVQRARQASKLCAYVRDSIEWLDASPVASLAYIAARAADQRSTADVADPYEAERTWQAEWLVARLGLGLGEGDGGT